MIEHAPELGGLETREGFVIMTVWLLIALCLIILTATLWPVISRCGGPSMGWMQVFIIRYAFSLYRDYCPAPGLPLDPLARRTTGMEKISDLCGHFFHCAYWVLALCITMAMPLMTASLSASVLAGMVMLLAERSTRAWMPSVMACLVHASVAVMALAISFFRSL